MAATTLGQTVTVPALGTGPVSISESEPRFRRLPHGRPFTCWYNFARINSSVRMSPAMAAHLTERLWDIGDIVKLIEEWEAQT